MTQDDTQQEDPSNQSFSGSDSITTEITHLITTAPEDWSWDLVVEFAERVGANKSDAKEAARALRREFDYGGPTAQMAAAQLWAMMLQNANNNAVFVHEMKNPRLIIALENLLLSSRTSTVVRLLRVIGAAAYASGEDSPVSALWKRVKPANKPDKGIPWKTDSMIRPKPDSKIPQASSLNPSPIPASHSDTATLPNNNVIDDGVHAYTQPRAPSPVVNLDYEIGKDETYSLDGRVNSDSENSANPLEGVPLSTNLAKFPRYDSSTIGKPADWLKMNHGHFLNYIGQSIWDHTAKMECTARTISLLPSPHLVIYMYETTGDLEILRAAVAAYEDCDILTALCEFRKIGDMLRHYFSRDPHRADGSEHDMDVIRNILALDADVICVRLYELTKDKEQYRLLVNLQGEEAQAMLDLMQTCNARVNLAYVLQLLDLPSLDKTFRSPLLNAILRLSRRSQLFPGRLWQEQVSLEGTEAIAAGKFGDVWKGVFCGQAVAVKVLKVYQKSDFDKHVKVRFLFQ
ncbi:hypothetical protein DXG01_002745 [Tephrocybe rancida]|nr:hypothetical protein DXG01_002745 [Tephrocybe rancida]